MAFWDKPLGKAASAPSEQVLKTDGVLEELQAQIKSLQNQVGMLDRQNEAYKYLESDLRASLTMLQDEYAALKPHYDAYFARYGALPDNTNVPPFPEASDDYDTELNKARLQVRALSARCLELEKQVNKQDVPVEEQSNPDDVLRIQQLEAQLKVYTRELEKKEAELQQMQTKYNNARGEIQQKNQLLATAKDLITKFRLQSEKRTSAESEKGITTDALKRRDEQIAELTLKVSQLMSENTELLTRNQELSSDVADITAEKLALQSDVKQLGSDKLMLQQELQSIKDEKSALSAEKFELLAINKEQENKNSELSEKVEELERRNSELVRYEQMAQSISSLMGTMNK